MEFVYAARECANIIDICCKRMCERNLCLLQENV